MDNKKTNQAIDKEIVKKVAKSAGWMGFKAKKKLAEAQEMGISPSRYLEKECWKMTDEELAEYAEKLEARRQLHHERVTQVVDAGGLSRKYASEKIIAARKAGLSFKQLMEREAYDLDDEDLPRLANALKAVKRRRADQRAYILDLLTQRSGWTRKNIIDHIKAASEKDLNIFNYFVNACWTLNDDQLDDIAQIYIERRSGSSDKREECIDFIASSTGWSRAQIELEILETTASCGCSYEDFARCHMWDMTLEERGNFISAELFRHLRFGLNDFVIGSPIFDYKHAFEDKFDSLIKRRHFKFDNMPKGEFFKKIDGLDSIVVKPDRGSCGIGIEILACNESYLKNGELYDYLIGIGKPLVIEEKIVQAEVLADLAPTSVNTLRIATLREGDQTHIIQCVLRVGLGAVVDNTHSGGLLMEIDPETGECLGDGVDFFGNLFPTHPITGKRFKGTIVPHIDKAIELVTQASQIVPECGFIGWDVAITPDGTELVEGNLKADHDGGQMAHLGVKWEGLRYKVIAPYVIPYVVDHSYLASLEEEVENAKKASDAPFRFSVVMPIYNVEAYLEEAIDSVISQSIGFEENVQLVLVNDGSSDGCEEICKRYEQEYPDNVVYVSQENAGVSAARNVGLEKATGAWINFMDADDRWASDAFEKAWGFIEKHPGETDVIGCRQKYFEAKSGYHGLDYKFKEDRVVSVMTHPECIQLSVASAFIARESLDGIRFDESLSIGEDVKLLTQVILEKERLGLLRSAKNERRKRDAGTSATQNRKENESAYTLTIDRYYNFIRDLSMEKFGRLIPYVQWCLTSGLKYRVIRSIPNTFTEGEKSEYVQKVISLIGQIDDGILLNAKHMTPSTKVYLLHLKHDKPMAECAVIRDEAVWVNNGKAFSYNGKNDIVLGRIDIADEELSIEGRVRIPGFVSSFEPVLVVGEKKVPLSIDDSEKLGKVSFCGETMETKAPFSIKAKFPEGKFDVHFETSYDDAVLENVLAFDDELGKLGKDGSSVTINDVSVVQKDGRTLTFG